MYIYCVGNQQKIKEPLTQDRKQFCQIMVNLPSSEDNFCGQVNQSVRYVHSCLESAIPNKTNTNKLRKSLVLESCVWVASSAAQAWFDRRIKNH